MLDMNCMDIHYCQDGIFWTIDESFVVLRGKIKT